MHTSIPIDNSMEVINAVEISPLISHAKVKVCYVGQDPNRNGTVITKEVATEMGRKLPGSPVVGLYLKDEKDFDEHNREIIIEGGKLSIVDVTKPYGFVPTNAEVWFQKFNDEGVEHEYLCTECYIWTTAYPESKRVIEQGNNQSMELNKEKQSGFWTNDSNSGKRIFIYNEALIEKLCILGQNVEPCFEGAQIKSQFSLENDPEFAEFKQTMYSMMKQLQETLEKGGSPMEENKDLELETPVEEFEKKPDPEEEKKETPQEEEKKEEHACGGGDDEKKKKYNLEEVTEYAELQAQYIDLENKYNELQAANTSMSEELTTLREFKAVTDRKNKQDMIDSFYMLNDEDKKDVVENIDTYTLDDIEAKLSIICVRNKVNFNLEQEDEHKEENQPNLFNLNDFSNDDGAPAWIKAVRKTANK